MRGRRAIASFVLSIIAVAPLQGQVLPGRWDLVKGLNPGTAIIIKLKTGDRLEGAFKGVSQDAVDMTEGTAGDRKIPKSVIQYIETSARVPDRLRNGTLIGLMIGAAGGIAAMVAFAKAKTNGPVYWGDEEGPSYLIAAALVGGGIGAATGAIIDASIKGHAVLYQAQ